ncbi:MAG: DUF924 family protein [Rhizobiaceae bacterium]|nr:DUF924 family protein [Rhizobiaceae bacterium]
MGQFFSTASGMRSAFGLPPNGAENILMFWRQSSRYWFSKNSAFDSFFKDEFAQLHSEVLEGRHNNWLADAHGALALILMTDQYPRNAFRGTGNMYYADELAVSFARIALKAGHADRVDERMKLFFFLPFAHSEELSDQQNRWRSPNNWDSRGRPERGITWRS